VSATELSQLNRIHIRISCIFFHSFIQGFVLCAVVLLRPKLISPRVPASSISSVSPRLVSSTCCTQHSGLFGSFLRVPSGSHSRILLRNLFFGILLTCASNFNRLSSVISHISLPTSIGPQIVSFRAFSSPDFLTDLLQKSISFGSSSLACCVFSVHVSASHYTRRLLRTEAW